ncbi:MAG: hypothetical protein KDC00_13380 [Flavobacteriales bacterium]|nr:hypothetical protein [Flavobacteriales bacterium]
MAPRTLHQVLRWASLIAGTLMLVFLLWMLMGHLLGDANGPHGMRFNNSKEIVAFTLFPCCTIIGLALAYKWPLIGGMVSVASIIVLFLLRLDLLLSPFLVTVVPGLLYMAHGWIGHKK